MDSQVLIISDRLEVCTCDDKTFPLTAPGQFLFLKNE